MTMLSVVIPAYNVQRDIPRTLASLHAQNSEAMEVIVVNDGSTDETEKVVRGFIQQHGFENIQVISQSNSGVSAARNHGLKRATGEFVLFLDGDDYISDGFIAEFHEVIRQHPSVQIVHWPYDLVDESGGLLAGFPYEETPVLRSGLETLQAVLLQKSTRIWTGSIAYRRDLLDAHGLLYTPGCRAGEDLEYIYKALSSAESVLFTGLSRSFYVQRSSSVMNSYSLNKFDAVQAMGRIRDYYKSRPGSDYAALAQKIEHHDLLHFYTGTYRMCLQHLMEERGLRGQAAIHLLSRELDQAYPGMRQHVEEAMKGRGLLRVPDKMDVFRLSPLLYLSLYKRTRHGRESSLNCKGGIRQHG